MQVAQMTDGMLDWLMFSDMICYYVEDKRYVVACRRHWGDSG